MSDSYVNPNAVASSSSTPPPPSAPVTEKPTAQPVSRTTLAVTFVKENRWALGSIVGAALITYFLVPSTKCYLL